MQHLVALQELEFGPGASSSAKKAEAEKLRAQIPPPILGHYDRLMARGKKGAAPVRNQVCAECHMQVPLGTVITIRKGEDIQLCGNCGRYLYVIEEAPAPPPPEAPPPPKAKRGRKPKKKPEDPPASG